MSATAQALALRRLMADSRVFSVLRSPLAPVFLAVIAEYYPSGATPKPASEIYEALDEDLVRLRSQSLELPKSPQAYCADWVGAGWLVRRPGSVATGETLEPSEEALVAIDLVARLSQRRSALSSSRITSLTERLESLARDTDPDVSSRLQGLYRQREELDKQIAAVAEGDFVIPAATEVLERITDILDSAAAIPADFARVRHEMEELNRVLRRKLLEPDGTRGDVLEDIFRGVDLIGDSEAGRSFSGFYAVLLDPERAEFVDNWLRQLLDREVTSALPEDVRSHFRRVFRDLEASGRDVNHALTTFSRSLRHYVTSDEFTQDRQVLSLLREARGAGAFVSERAAVKLTTKMSTTVDLIGMAMTSVSSIRLRNPGSERVIGELEDMPTVHVDTEALLAAVRLSEIDLDELRNNVLTSVKVHRSATVGTVLSEYPATQGLASIVGLLHLGMRYGYATFTSEQVFWAEEDREITARIPGWSFDHSSLTAWESKPSSALTSQRNEGEPQ